VSFVKSTLFQMVMVVKALFECRGVKLLLVCLHFTKMCFIVKRAPPAAHDSWLSPLKSNERVACVCPRCSLYIEISYRCSGLPASGEGYPRLDLTLLVTDLRVPEYLPLASPICVDAWVKISIWQW
jgi:hypothetical protein